MIMIAGDENSKMYLVLEALQQPILGLSKSQETSR